MTAHLGNRVSALIDGQLSQEDADRDWTHVYTCEPCRELVEREGWVKNRLARLSAIGTTAGCPSGASDSLKGALSGLTPAEGIVGLAPTWDDVRPSHPHVPEQRRPSRASSLAALGGSAVGAAVVGILALGAAPADSPITPNISRVRTPQTGVPLPSGQIGQPGPVVAFLRK